MNDKFMTPKAIVNKLDKFIVGQSTAKRAVAIALRNRWRRSQLNKELKKEVTPKNILMIGPTGVGKTEIARRLANLANAPFIKVEATKFTEVGYVGRDVESIIRDLMDISIKRSREIAIQKVKKIAKKIAEKRILDILLPSVNKNHKSDKQDISKDKDNNIQKESLAKKLYKKKLREGKLNNKKINIKIIQNPISMEFLGPPGMEEIVGQIQNMIEGLANKKTKIRRMTIKQALKYFQKRESSRLINEEEIKFSALKNVENNGIVFLDEIDKIVKSHNMSQGGDISREGVQRDLLPLVEGSTIFTKYGIIKTDHILFIASGAFHLSKPSDLIPEMQGRFPIRVELNPLTVQDFIKILTEPKHSLTKQYIALMKTENLYINFTKNAIKRLAEISHHINDTSENIGARRLYTIMERLLDNISFESNNCKSKNKIKINTKYVNKQLHNFIDNEDLNRYIL